jgi:hypothetical protein
VTPVVPAEVGRRWIEAWNSRDLDRILALYDDDAEMTSAGIVRLGLNAEGRLRGQDNLRAYWTEALRDLPDLCFALLEVAASPDSVIVRYRNDRGEIVSEYLRLGRDGRIVQGSSNHKID